MKKFIIIFTIVVALIGVLTLMFYLNTFNMKNVVMKNLSSIPVLNNVLDINSVTTLKKQLQEKIAEVNREKAQLQNKIDQVNAKQQELDQAEQQLKVMQQQLNNTKKLTQGQVKSISDLAKFYENMDPKAAAAIMQKLDDNTIAVLLKNMQKQSASDIMQNMDPVRAAKVTKIMMGM